MAHVSKLSFITHETDIKLKQVLDFEEFELTCYFYLLQWIIAAS